MEGIKHIQNSRFNKKYIKDIHCKNSKIYSKLDQVRRAAVSILSNIAEGFERGSNAELVHFLYISKGSAGELRAQMYVALDQGYITNGDCLKVNDRCKSISSQIAGLIKYLKRSGLKGSKFNNEA